MKDVFGVLEVDTSSPYVRVVGDAVFIAPPEPELEDLAEFDPTGWADLGFITEAE